VATQKKKAPAAKKAAAGKKEVPLHSNAPTGNFMHGVEVLGDVKKGGNAKLPVTAQLLLSQIKVIKGFNPRSDIGDIDTLAKSIKKDGLLSALVVRPSGKDGTFDLIAGERRYRALESLDWKSPVPVLIRTDLVDDDDRALAVAVAENSEDGRSNLNVVELGNVCQGFAEKGWDVSRIASECGMHAQKVRRMLTLMAQPKALRDKLAKGEVTLTAGLELAKLDDSVRDDVIKAMDEGGASSAQDIRRLRKQVETEKSLEGAATSGPKKTDRGTTPKRVPTAWRGSREKQQLLQELAAKLQGLTKDETDADFLETRAMVCVLLWDRGDLQSVAIPHEDAKDTASVKALKVFWSIVGQEAAKQKESVEDAADSDAGDGDGESDGEEKPSVKKVAAKKKPAKKKPAKKIKPEPEAEEGGEEEPAEEGDSGEEG
jgi:ParB family chromosome partitioning protein